MNHSHGYAMRLQRAAELARETAEQKRTANVTRWRRIEAFDRLSKVLNAINSLPETLAAYEATNDHDHGYGPIKIGTPCPGGDCLVYRAQEIIKKLEG